MRGKKFLVCVTYSESSRQHDKTVKRFLDCARVDDTRTTQKNEEIMTRHLTCEIWLKTFLALSILLSSIDSHFIEISLNWQIFLLQIYIINL